MIDITQPNMILMKDGAEVSRHRSAVEAMENAAESGAGTYTLVRPDATIVVEGEQPTDPVDPVDPDPVDPDPVDPPAAPDNAFATPESTSRFLSLATFGATREEIESLEGTSASEWFLAQKALPASSHFNLVDEALPESHSSILPNPSQRRTPNLAFWEIAVGGADQLRQRIAFALSQILVISNAESSGLSRWPVAVSSYQDILGAHAFGNYRDLLEEVTYSPAMGSWLTYLRSKKADPVLGTEPDENYAREIMQLFTIGLVELNQNGSHILFDGEDIETYNNDDITGLAKVFTGLNFDLPTYTAGRDGIDSGAQARRMKAFDEYHSTEEKSFLGVTIPAGTGADESIRIALDTLVDHPNTAPFISRQLIQRFTESDPSGPYVTRVANAFADGQFTLPNGEVVGDGRRGDLSATMAAVLFDVEAAQGTKIREPAIRCTHWARNFALDPKVFGQHPFMWNANGISQYPYRANSVFNFYRPGYVAQNTESGDLGMTVPELQIVSGASVLSNANFMDGLIFDGGGMGSRDYAYEESIAGNRAELLDHLDLVLTHGTLSQETRDAILALPTGGVSERVKYITLFVMTSPDYVVMSGVQGNE